MFELVEGLGYRLRDIHKSMTDDEYLDFYGQTGAISSKGEFLVYPYDYDRYMKHKT